MSDRRTIDVDVELSGDLTVEAEFGQTVTEIVAPEHYLGPFSFFPSDQDQVIPVKDKTPVEDITIDGITGNQTITENGTYNVLSDKLVTVNIQPDLRPLAVDSLTQQGAFLPTGDGFSQVNVEEQWDGTLFPVTDETDPLYESKVFNAKWVRVYTGDTVIVEGYGRGRILGFRGEKTLTVPTLPNTVNINVRSDPQFDYMRFKFDVTEDCILVVAGYYSSPDGGHSANTAYIFRGDWIRWKVIHAS